MAHQRRAKKPTGWHQKAEHSRPLGRRDRLEARRKTQPFKPLKVADVSPRLCLLVDLGINDCRFPYDVDGGGSRFCGLQKETWKVPYCPAHMRLCYRPVVPLKYIPS